MAVQSPRAIVVSLTFLVCGIIDYKEVILRSL